MPCLMERMTMDLTEVVDRTNDRLVIDYLVKNGRCSHGLGEHWRELEIRFFRFTMDIFTLI